MKPILVSITIFAILATAGAANPANVILYEERDYQGESILLTIQPGQCIRLADFGWAQRAVSIIPTHSNCFKLYFNDDCGGAAVHKDVFTDYNNDLHMNFMGRSARGIDFTEGNCF